MKNILYSLCILCLCSCNNIVDVVDEVKSLSKQTIDYNDYRYVIDKKDRRGYVTTDNEIMNGHYVVLRDGELYEEFQIKKGFLHGVHIEYGKNGSIDTQKSYKHSYLDGPYFSYYPSGVLKYETAYKNGKINSAEIEYDANGKKSRVMETVDGVAYDHMYRNDQQLMSIYEKEIEDETFEIIMKYDNFQNIELILGKKTKEKTPEFYVFDTNFEIVEIVNAQIDPQTAAYYLGMLRITP
ncbi:MAG: hypothetical protein MK211_06720 [Flavobacteriales bacterium]|nr:hypothetical protein [Flavobacteriales bacterium]